MDSGQLTEELSLKVNVALHGLVSDYQRGLISKAQVRTGIRAIADSVIGLVTPDTFELIGVIDREFKTVPYHAAVETRMICVDKSKGLVRAVQWTVGSSAVYRLEGRLIPVQRPDYNDPEAAQRGKETFEREVAKLTEQSW